MQNILNKLKNKEDFKSITIQTTTAQIFIQLVKTYFEKQNKYNIIIDYYKYGTRTTKHNQTKQQILDILKDFEILKAEQ